MPTLDEYRKDTREDWVIDFWDTREQQERNSALERVTKAIKAAQDAVAAEHRRNGLNLIDVADYLTAAMGCVESEKDD